IEYFQHAIVKDPAYSLAYVGLALAYAELGLGHAAGALKPREAYQQARKAVAKALELDEGLGEAHGMLAFLRVACDFDWTGAERELERAVALAPGNTLFLAELGQAYALVGQVERARDVLKQLQGLSQRRYVSPYHIAYVYTGLGELDRAMDSLERAYEERAGGVYGIKGSFLFTTLRSHPRFAALLRKMNLVS